MSSSDRFPLKQGKQNKNIKQNAEQDAYGRKMFKTNTPKQNAEKDAYGPKNPSSWCPMSSRPVRAQCFVSHPVWHCKRIGHIQPQNPKFADPTNPPCFGGKLKHSHLHRDLYTPYTCVLNLHSTFLPKVNIVLIFLFKVSIIMEGAFTTLKTTEQANAYAIYNKSIQLQQQQNHYHPAQVA